VTEPLGSADVDLDTQFIFKVTAQRQNPERVSVLVKPDEKVHVALRRVVASHHAAKHSNVPRVMLRRESQEGVTVRFDQFALG
jgi:hypothetical protein